MLVVVQAKGAGKGSEEPKKERDWSKVKCFKCKQFGHMIADCPQKD
jgi:hypothetical protein